MGKAKETINHKKMRHLIRSILASLVLLGYLLQGVAGTVYYSKVIKAYGIVASPPLLLNQGTAGYSTIFTNSTSASVRTGVGDFNYVLNMTENRGSNWKVRLFAYDQSNTSRLSNCSIYIYDGSNSTQIIISNGAYSQQTGNWCDLAVLDTEYIWMHVETSSAGTSNVYAYLEILTPGRRTYSRYIVTFEIT